MDRSAAKHLINITTQLHDDTDSIYEEVMEGDLEKASKLVDEMMKSLKHLKSNLKTHEV